MAYNILYIEDQDPASIISRIEADDDFVVQHLSPNTIDEVLASAKDKHLILLDFKLTESTTEAKISVDAPSIASAFRTFGSESHKDIPIILISTRENITNYYKDFSSKDLFDFSTPKDVFLDNLDKYRNRLHSFIRAYSIIKENKKDTNVNLAGVLNVSEEFLQSLDYRISFNLEKDMISGDIFAYSNFITQNIIRSIGLLIGEGVLSARLGISVDSENWGDLKAILAKYKYSGVLSDSYNRWWAKSINNWFLEATNQNMSLRRLDAEQRCEMIKKVTKLEGLNPLTKINERGYTAKSSKFWTICKYTKQPIDYIDGFELYERELFPWQEAEYISFLGISSKRYFDLVKPNDKSRIREIEKQLRG